MRQYQEGDDLRRIHWPSVARTGELMIRQDESSRRASGLVFLDTRADALGQSHTPAFERAVSVAASIGVLLSRRGFVLRLGTTGAAGGRAVRGSVPRRAHRHLARRGPIGRPRARPPARRLVPGHLAGLRRGPARADRARRVDPRRRGVRSQARGPGLPDRPRTPAAGAQAQLEGRASQARLSLARAGWDVIVLPPR